MKSFLKKSFLLVPLLSVSIVACNNTGNNTTGNTDTTIGGHLKEAANNIGAAASQAADKVKDAADQTITEIQSSLTHNPDSTFIAKAYKSNLEELKLTQVALNKGNNAVLMADARKIQDDHNKLGMRLSEFAGKYNYRLPSDTAGVGNAKVDEINNAGTGNNWDKAWVAKMIREHNGDINYFEAAKDKVKNAELRALIISTLPVLRNHRMMLENLQDNL